MRKGEDIRDEISFNRVDGLESAQLIRAIRNKAFGENKHEDSKYMAVLASLCFDGPALRWFEHLDEDAQSDWALLRRGLLARFPASVEVQESSSPDLLFTGDNSAECENFVRSVRKHSHAEGKSGDDVWMAHYAAGCMTGDALKWHTKLNAPLRNSWIQLERALLAYFPEPPSYDLTPAGRVLVEHWEPTHAPSFIPMSEGAWLREARRRRAAYSSAGPGGLSSVHWLLVERGEAIPDTAIQTGLEANRYTLFSARVWVEDGLYPCKLVGHGSPGPYVSYMGKEIRVDQPYEVLVGDASAIRWISNPSTARGAGKPPGIHMKGFHAVEGGRQTEGWVLLVAQAYREGYGWQVGKVGPGWNGCQISWYGEEHFLPNFRILVWAE